MTPEEQWELINTAQADQAVFSKVRAVRQALATNQIEVPEVKTNVSGVPLLFREAGAMIHIEVGRDASQKALITLDIPTIWLEA